MRWPGLDLRPIAAGDLDARDRRLAQAIYGQVIRRWLTLEHLLNTRLERPLRELEAKMQAVLLAGAARAVVGVVDQQAIGRDPAGVLVAWTTQTRRVDQGAGLPVVDVDAGERAGGALGTEAHEASVGTDTKRG